MNIYVYMCVCVCSYTLCIEIWFEIGTKSLTLDTFCVYFIKYNSYRKVSAL